MENDFCYFENHDCKYYPCHKDCEHINCMFCYCPFYNLEKCPGSPSYIYKTGIKIKKCTDCVFPHKKENYKQIIEFLKMKKNECKNEVEYFHGGECFLKKECADYSDIKFDFSVNTNPLGSPKGIRHLIKKNIDLCSEYPERNCSQLKKGLQKKYALNSDYILIGNGASELISLIARNLKMQNRSLAFLVEPTFSGYKRALLANDFRIENFLLNEEDNFNLGEGFINSIPKNTDVIFLCNPNNPTGTLLSKNIVKRILNFCKENNIFLVIDECFIEFLEDEKKYSAIEFVEEYKNLIVLNAFTKTYALAGLRLGFAFCSDINFIKNIQALQSEWSVSVFAQMAGAAALKEKVFLQKTMKMLNREKRYLKKEFDSLGIKYFNTCANFILIKTEKYVYEKLLKEKILVRSCCNFQNLNERFLRISIQKHGRNKILIRTLKRILNDR